MREKFVRTMIPVLVAVLTSVGVPVDEKGLLFTVVIPAVVGTSYYLTVRVLEVFWPGAGWLLGYAADVVYDKHEILAAILRTVTPLVVAGFVQLGLAERGVDDTALLGFVTTAVTGGYYALFGWLEKKYPKVGAFLGWAQEPLYQGRHAA